MHGLSFTLFEEGTMGTPKNEKEERLGWLGSLLVLGLVVTIKVIELSYKAEGEERKRQRRRERRFHYYVRTGR
jgi:hypothetical protein